MGLNKKFDEAYIKSQYILNKITSKLKKIYRQAYKKIKNEFEKYLKSLTDEDEKMKNAESSGKISQEQYQDWRAEKVMTGKEYQKILKKFLKILGNIDKNASQIINDLMPEVYYINKNFTVRTVSEHYKMKEAELSGKDAVADLLPKSRIDIPKNQRWNRQKLNSAVTLGILNGESIDEIAERVAKVAEMNRTTAMRTATTMVTAAQNAGRMDGYRQCQRMGMRLKHGWLAATDGHTRDSHKAINGEIVEIGEAFSNGLEYPADPRGEPAEVYNCRCCTIAVFDD